MKRRTFRKKRLYLLLLLAFTIQLASAQNTVSVRLTDNETFIPVEGATFMYGTQQGISNSDGIIEFRYTEDESMKISHVSYGELLLTAHQVKQLVEEKQLSLQRKVIDLYPVSIISIRSQALPTSDIRIEHNDKMSHDATTLLQQLPFVSSVKKGGNYGLDPVIRGFKYDQLNLVINGVQSVIAACPNRMDPPISQMAPNMMDKIEVYKGPYALRFGTGFGGTINFFSTKPQFSNTLQTYGRLSGGYEENGSSTKTEGHLGIKGNWYNLGISGAWAKGKDYTSGDGTLIPADFTRTNVGSYLGFKLSPRQVLNLTATYNAARNVDFPSLPMDLTSDDTWVLNASHSAAVQKGSLQSWNTTLYASLVNHVMDNLVKPLNPRTLNAATDATTVSYGGRTEGTFHFNSNVLYLGLDGKLEGAEGSRTREFLAGPMAGKTFFDNVWQDGQLTKFGVFGEYQMPLGLQRFVVSARLESATAEAKDIANEFLTLNTDSKVTHFNPSVSLGMVRDLTDNSKVSLWLGRAQRSGSIAELFINYFPVGLDPYELVGNMALKPEVNNQADLVWNIRGDRFQLNADVFYSYLQDFISSSVVPGAKPRIMTSPGVRLYDNIDKAFKTGFEITWLQSLFSGLQHNFGIAYTYGQDLTRDEPLPEIYPLDLRYTLYGNFFNNKLMPELGFRYVARQDRISEEYGELATPAFTLLNFKTAYHLSDLITMNAGINNLLNENYYEHLFRPYNGTKNPVYAAGRNFYASLILSF